MTEMSTAASWRAAALDEPDAHLLSYEHTDEYNGGSRWPYSHKITATHPERGEVGHVKYYTSSDRVNAKIKIDKLEVGPDHQRRGYGSALMDELQRQHPKSSIDHGDRTDAGSAWWSAYGEGRADRRGRTAAALEVGAAAFAARVANSQYRHVTPLSDEHLDDNQRRALDRLKGEDEVIRGDRLTKLMAEHGIHRHDSSPEDRDPDAHKTLQWNVGRERFLDADHPLHTSQDYLHRPTLEHLIRSPMLMVDKDDDFGPRIYQEDHPHGDGRYWLQEGHHRTMADRMTARQGWSYDLRETSQQAAARGRNYGPRKNAASRRAAAEAVDPRAHEVGPGHEWRQALPPEHEEVVRHWERHSPSMTAGERAMFRKVIRDAPPVDGPVYRGVTPKNTFGFVDKIKASHKPGQKIKFSKHVSTSTRPEVASGYGHVMYEIHDSGARALGNRLHEAVAPPGEYTVHSVNWDDQTPARSNTDERTTYDSPRLHVVLHPAQQRTAFQRTAITREPLPQGNDLYYRFHHREAPFGGEHAQSYGLHGDDKPQMGHSSFSSPHDLNKYLHDMDWVDAPEEVDFADRDVIAFRGDRVGTGLDHEPLVMPHHQHPEYRMTWSEFQQRLPHTPGKPSWSLDQAKHHSNLRTAAIKMIPHHELKKFEFPDYPNARTPAALAKHFKKTSPEYFEKVKRDVAENGFSTPALVKWTDPGGRPLKKPRFMEGHHRAAVAHELGIPLPVGDYDDMDDYDRSFKAGQEWWRSNQRPTDDMPGRQASADVKVGFLQAQAISAPHPMTISPALPILSRLAFLPTKRLFGPTYGLDTRLFDGDHLKPDVRRYILETLGDFWKLRYGVTWDEWAVVYLAGSEASEWTSEDLQGNGDFDVLIGVDYEAYRKNSSRTDPAQHMTDEEIIADLNAHLKKLTAKTDPTYIVVDGKPTGPWSNTWYVNQDSYDIRKIKPYAAYDVTHDRWAVKPPHLPKWDISQFPEGPALVAEAKAVSAYVRAILAMPEPYRTQQGYALWHHLHSDRSRAFSEQGEGWYDPGNVLEKWLDQEGLWEKLVEIMVRVKNDPSTMNAPEDWSNNPG